MRRRLWTQEEIRILQEMYPTHFASDIAAVLDRSICSIYGKAKQLGLRAREDYRSLAGKIGAKHQDSIATRFKKGHVPANKGQKMPADVYEKVAKTMFRKGNIPQTHKPVGTTLLRRDGYVWVKIAEPNRWKQKHRLLWESEHGPIPPGHNVQFRNKDRTDVRIENLYLISRSDQMLNENSLIASYPKPLVDIIRLKGAIKRQIHRHEKNGKQKHES